MRSGLVRTPTLSYSPVDSPTPRLSYVRTTNPFETSWSRSRRKNSSVSFPDRPPGGRVIPRAPRDHAYAPGTNDPAPFTVRWTSCLNTF